MKELKKKGCYMTPIEFSQMNLLYGKLSGGFNLLIGLIILSLICFSEMKRNLEDISNHFTIQFWALIFKN